MHVDESRTMRRLENLDLGAEPMVIEIGPSHPAMHGTVRMKIELEGAAAYSAYQVSRQFIVSPQ